MKNTDFNVGHCVVTGGAGFIGSALSFELANIYKRVVVFDNLHPQIHKIQRRPDALDVRCELVVGDVTDALAWDALLSHIRPEVIVHLAAETGTGQSLTESNRHAMVNVVGTAQMLDALHRSSCQPKRIVLSSSRAVYGEGDWKLQDGKIIQPGQRTQQQLELAHWDFPNAVSLPFDAAVTRAAPTSIYGATKLAQEHLVNSWSLAHEGTSPRILRLQNVYGPGQSLSNPYTGIVSLFVQLAKQGKSIPLYEDGKMLRDFVYIDDVASALLASIAVDAQPSPLDVGTGEATSIRQIAEAIAMRYEAPQPHVCGKFRNGDVRHASCDIAQTRAVLNWEPKVDWRAGLFRLCDWIDSQIDNSISGKGAV